MARFNHFVLILFIGLMCCSTSCKHKSEHQNPIIVQNTTGYFESVQNHRDALDSYFKSKDSPLSDSMKRNFTGIHYFPIDTNYKVNAHFEQMLNGDVFQMSVSGSIADVYQTVGTLKFNLDNKECTLEVYLNKSLADEGTTVYFIPFYDLTSGKDTYGGGRYLDLKEMNGKELILDFNYCYQPYCLYNHEYSCPIPPMQNTLTIEIKAGEKL